MRLLKRKNIHDIFLVCSLLGAANATELSVAAGLLVFCAGLALHIWAKGVLVRNKVLCDQGPYALCRHPFYLANALIDLGLCVMSGAVPLIVIYPIAFWVAYWPTIRQEDKALRALFGEKHEAFCAATPAVLPSLRGLLRCGSVRLSWANLLVERELSRVLRHLSFPLLVILAAKLWARPDLLLTAPVLLLVCSAVALNYLSVLAYCTVEAREAKSRVGGAFLRLSRWGVVGAAALLLLAVFARDQEAEALALPAGLAVVLLGWYSLTDSIGRIGRRGANLVARIGLVGQAAIVLGGLSMLVAGWLAPIGVGLCLSAVLMRPSPILLREHHRVRLACALLAVVAGFALCDYVDPFGSARRLHRVESMLARESGAGAKVVVVRDGELASICQRPYSQVTANPREAILLADGALKADRVLFVVEDDQARPIIEWIGESATIRMQLRIGLERFYVIESQRFAGRPLVFEA